MLNRKASTSTGWRWVTIGFVGCILVLVVLNGVLMLLRARPEAEIASVPGRLLYTTTFEDAQRADWQLGDTTQQAVIEQGELRLSIGAERSSYFVVLPRVLSDVDVRLNVKWLTEPDVRGQIGVRFREDADTSEAGYYEFKLDNRGAYRVEIVRAGHMPEVLSDWQITPFALNGKGQINQVRVVAKAFVFSFYVNEHPLPLCLKGQEAAPKWVSIDGGACQTDGQRVRTELVEQTMSSGLLSIGIYSDAGMFSTAFDNLLIYGPR